MKKINFIAVLSLVVFALSQCSKPDIGPTDKCNWVAGSDSSAKHPKQSALNALIRQYVAKGMPGMSVLIEDKNGVWVGAAGYSDLERKIPFEPCTVSKAASITKLFNYALVYKLMETGAPFRLSDKISKWIPANQLDGIENADQVTLRQCMNHTTGIYDVITDQGFYLDLLNNPNKVWSADDLLKHVKGKTAYFQPGEKAEYSNTNTLLVSLVVEHAMNRSHAELLKEKILAPLGLSNTFYQGREKLPSTVAQGYFDLYNNNTIVNVSNLITGSGNGYGGMFSNLHDLHRFINALLIDKTLLSQASIDSMMQFDPRVDGENNYGPGLMKKFVDLGVDYGLGHSGRDLGYSADLFYFPDKKFTMIFFVNYGTDANSALKPVFKEFERKLIDILRN